MFYILIHFMQYRSNQNRFDYMAFPVRLWLTYGLLKRTNAFWRREPVHLQSWGKYLRQTLVFVSNMVLRVKFSFYFQEFFASIEKKLFWDIGRKTEQ